MLYVIKCLYFKITQIYTFAYFPQKIYYARFLVFLDRFDQNKKSIERSLRNLKYIFKAKLIWAVKICKKMQKTWTTKFQKRFYKVLRVLFLLSLNKLVQNLRSFSRVCIVLVQSKYIEIQVK